ncbi:Stc1 domain-containing protein [Talaromyces proteolyticus]|uniref:Stc1 domain-containing protein n=1 Tax=Talaromyces proteolyticus TaxID=1131652 RepID=A0AAD4KU23_9EURO|nr:Stc1 domain-containing protein [Talaromyces proteolyticus]KAH8699286.1 Stc1 domain-containing protein [Talaromyces proteolyticus]
MCICKQHLKHPTAANSFFPAGFRSFLCHLISPDQTSHISHYPAYCLTPQLVCHLTSLLASLHSLSPRSSWSSCCITSHSPESSSLIASFIMAGGWSASKVDRVRNAMIPQTLRCCGCNKSRPLVAFSNAQITRLKGQVSSKGRSAIDTYPLRCRQCTGGEPPVEITCVRCTMRKPISDFSKKQRRNIDTAMCVNCVSDGLLSTPYESNELRDRGEDLYAFNSHEDDESVITESVAGGVALGQFEEKGCGTEVASRFSRPSHPSSDDDEDDSVKGGLFVEDVRSLQETSSTVHAEGQVSTAMGRRAGNDEYAWQLNQKKPGQLPNTKSHKWAKIKAHDPFRSAKEMQMHERRSPEMDDTRSGFGGSVAQSSSFF